MNVPDWFHGLSSALDVKMGMILDEVTPARAVGRYPVDGNTQPFGIHLFLRHFLPYIYIYSYRTIDNSAVWFYNVQIVF